MEGFKELHQNSLQTGSIDNKTKELIAVGIAIAIRCEGCIAFHVHDALRAGATKEEVVETIGVAIMMGGGPALMYGCEALQAVQEFLEKRAATAN
jgi:AhpD family alkylhydroperoxidase